MPPRIDLSSLLERLKSADASVRDAAGTQLLDHARVGLTAVEALRALQEAGGPFPAREDGRDSAADLIRAAARTPRRVYVPVIEECFSRYGERARLEALRLLLRVGERKAAQAFLTLATRHGAELAGLGTEALLDDPRHLDAIFPAVLTLVAYPRLAAELSDTTSALLVEGLLDPKSLECVSGPILAAEAERREAMARLRASTAVGWERQADYLARRAERTALLDLIGWLPGEMSEAALRVALKEPDRRVKAFAVAALLRRDAQVAPAALAEVAADLELRTWLTARLAEARKRAVLPEPEEG